MNLPSHTGWAWLSFLLMQGTLNIPLLSASVDYSRIWNIVWDRLLLVFIEVSFHKLQTIQIMSNLILCQTLDKNSVNLWLMDVQCFGLWEILFYIELLLEVNRRSFSCKFVKRSSIYEIEAFLYFDQNVLFIKTAWKLFLELALHNVSLIINPQKKYSAAALP